MAKLVEGRCSERVWGGILIGNGQCLNKAKMDGLCGVHANVAERKRKREARYASDAAIDCSKRAQAAFVAAWRERNPTQVWANAWICPLCNVAVNEMTMGSAAFHQDNHGADWTDYQALAEQAEG